VGVRCDGQLLICVAVSRRRSPQARPWALRVVGMEYEPDLFTHHSAAGTALGCRASLAAYQASIAGGVAIWELGVGHRGGGGLCRMPCRSACS